MKRIVFKVFGYGICLLFVFASLGIPAYLADFILKRNDASAFICIWLLFVIIIGLVIKYTSSLEKLSDWFEKHTGERLF